MIMAHGSWNPTTILGDPENPTKRNIMIGQSGIQCFIIKHYVISGTQPPTNIFFISLNSLYLNVVTSDK